MAIARGRAIFIDKDGTLIHNVPYNVDPRFIRFYEGAAKALKLLKEAGFSLIVVSNQSGVARGLFDEAELKNVNSHIQSLLKRYRVAVDDFYYCIHAPDDGCSCRKPQPGLLKKAASEHGIDLKNSWMIGDILNDVEAGKRAGCRTVLIDNGNETEWKSGDFREADFTFKTLLEAAHYIINDLNAGRSHEKELSFNYQAV